MGPGEGNVQLLAIKIATKNIFSFAAEGERVQRKHKHKVEGVAKGIGKIIRRMVRGRTSDSRRERKMEEKLRRKRKGEARQALNEDQGQTMMQNENENLERDKTKVHLVRSTSQQPR